MTTRRRALIGVAGVTVGGLGLNISPRQAAPAQAATVPSATAADRGKGQAPPPRTVDVHAHYVTPAYRKALLDAGISQPDGMPAIPDWSADKALQVMDRTGISVAMLSVSSPGFALGDAGKTRTLVRLVNQEGADLVKANPSRFGLFASLPLPDVEAAVAEVAYAYDVLQVDGIAMETNYEDTYLGDPTFRPVLAELNKRKAVVHLHPTSPACWEATALGRPRPMVEFLFDTTRTVAQLILDNVIADYPGIRFIVPHAGAALPVMADRIAAFATLSTPPVDVIGALKRLYYDVAGFSLPRALPALLNLVDSSRLLYGSDYPFTSDVVVQALAGQLGTTTALSAGDKQRMFAGNALGLFPRLGER
ncbi:amidohydrolase family protein [Streptomyces galbus]|uniref:Amidohydrolase n=1 Tax=Streptomyces galbus TaxID=33898 RepID=A0A4U5X1Z9_STRGB|nr:amidohydrolase family protein [Streptomyces galbus]TKT08031.1 amidohydrolase [Streptomyces galbus]GHD42329.1 amidohydrolase [Streptomyces galbus]